MLLGCAVRGAVCGADGGALFVGAGDGAGIFAR